MPTVVDALALCGISNVGPVFNGDSPAERVSADIFADDFMTCMDKTFSELDEDWKTYSSLTAANRQLRFVPSVKRNVRAFVQWCRDQIRTGRNPADSPFPINDAADLIRRSKTHHLWVSKASDKAKNARPKQFTEEVKWEDWRDSFSAFLRSQPGRNGVPLSYVIRENAGPIYRVNTQFLDDYVDQAPLDGEAYAADAEEVHSYIINFITENKTAENKILPFLARADGRVDYQALKDHYEGVGANAKDIIKAEGDVQNLFYAGEKKPHMWWEEFETRLTVAFSTIDRTEGRQVHSDIAKLRMLQRKIKADFLEGARTNIELELAKTPMTMTYDVALSTYRNAVNHKFPAGEQVKKSRRIQQVGRDGSGRGRGRGGRSGRGRGRGRGNGRGGRGNRNRLDAWFVQCTDGKRLEVHPSYSFSDEQWETIPQEVKDKLIRMRQEYRQRRQTSQSSSYASHYAPYTIPPTIDRTMPPTNAHHIQQIQVPNVPPPPPPRDNPHSSGISQVTTDQHIQPSTGTIMGGRSEQEQLRSRNPNRSISHVTTTRKISSSQAHSVSEPKPNTVGSNEADTNADTCCLGANFIPISFTNRTADVYPYDDSYEPAHNIPIVSGATAFDHPDGNTYILIFNESLYYGTKLKHSLINPNQIRHFGLDFWDNPFDEYHNLEINTHMSLIIPLQRHGTKISFETRSPTPQELQSCKHIHMTNDIPWNPHDVKLGMVSPDYDRKQSTTVCISSHKSVITPYCYSTEQQYIYPSTNDDDYTLLHSVDPSLADPIPLILSQVAQDMAENDYQPERIPARRTFIDRNRHRAHTAQSIAEMWNIGLKKAKDTLQVTTQNGIRSAIMPLSRRYRSDRMYNVKRLNGKFATDTFFSNIKSLHGNTCAQIISHKVGFSVCYPLPRADGEHVGHSLLNFIHNFGAPEHLTFDGAQVQMGRHTLFQQTLRRHNIQFHVSSPQRPNENPGEAAIRELKRRMYRIAHKKQIPRRVWDYLVVWTCETGNLSVSSSRYAAGRTPIEYITGETPDISEYLDFGFYDWVTYRTNAGLGDLSIGRWLGVSHKVGQLMSYWVLTIAGRVISCVNVQRMTPSEKETTEFKEQMQRYDKQIADIDDAAAAEQGLNHGEIPDWNRLSLDEDDPEFLEANERIVDDDGIPHAEDQEDSHTPDTLDPYINMELAIARGDGEELHHARVKRRAIDQDGRPIGTANNNPMIDTRQYEVEYLDGSVETLVANTIAENLFAQIDEEGHRQLLLSEIIDHRSTDEAIPKDQGFYTTRHGMKRRKMTTKGWELCVEWKDGSQTWVALKDMKHSYPVQLADYATRNGISDEPAYAWWVPYVLKKRKAVISKVKSKYWDKTHKYGIRLPKSVDEALEIDREEGNNHWRDGINEEMKKINDAFELYDGDPTKLVGYQQITTHFIFDIKLGENFRRKARLVADGHKTQPPKSVTYSSVVSRDSVRICLMLAALNELDIQAADIENAYLTAPCREKCWTIGGKEFGSNAGKPFIIRRALYGLKSSGAAFREHLAQRLDEIGFKSSISDPDVWLRPATKPDGEQYYEYMLVYVDDILCISHDPMRPMKQIAEVLRFKKDKIEPPEFYLGARIENKKLNGKDVWTMSSKDYVKAAVDNVVKHLEKKGRKLPTRATTPMAANYIPELDDSPELDTADITTFQESIGVLRWATEIGRVDIATEVSMLSSYQAAPREGHLEQVYHIFAYLQKKPKLTLYFDPSPPKLDPSWATGDPSEVFKQTYRDAKEQLPPSHMQPPPRGRSVSITAFVDASHAANKVTRRSHSGFVLFLNRAPVMWYTKRQNTVESSTFSSEFIALKICVEHIIALRYKLRMFGVPIDESAKVLCDNESVVRNSSRLESSLNKKHCALAYHSVRWAVAAGVISIGWIPTDLNIADAMTKRLTVAKQESLFSSWTY